MSTAAMLAAIPVAFVAGAGCGIWAGVRAFRRLMIRALSRADRERAGG